MPLARPDREQRSSAEAVGGWHWTEWSCELVGTALLLLGGLSAICLDFGPGSVVGRVLPDHSARLLLTGLLFSGTGALVTVSPIGRRSGAHLNPAVTFSFWCTRRVHSHDLAGYVLAQCAGALIGTALVRALWGSTAIGLNLGVTQPGHGIGGPGAAGIEALMTSLLVGTILLMVSSKATAPWTPLAVWIVVAVLVWQGAPWTGTSLNPARSLAPALLRPELHDLWAYIVGPLTGAGIAAAAITVLPGVEPLTAKLYYDVRYPSSFKSLLPMPARPFSSGRRARRDDAACPVPRARRSGRGL